MAWARVKKGSLRRSDGISQYGYFPHTPTLIDRLGFDLEGEADDGEMEMSPRGINVAGPFKSTHDVARTYKRIRRQDGVDLIGLFLVRRRPIISVLVETGAGWFRCRNMLFGSVDPSMTRTEDQVDGRYRVESRRLFKRLSIDNVVTRVGASQGRRGRNQPLR